MLPSGRCCCATSTSWFMYSQYQSFADFAIVTWCSTSPNLPWESGVASGRGTDAPGKPMALFHFRFTGTAGRKPTPKTFTVVGTFCGGFAPGAGVEWTRIWLTQIVGGQYSQETW